MQVEQGGVLASVPLWTRSGDQGDAWHRALVPVPPGQTEETFKVSAKEIKHIRENTEPL